MSQVEEIERAVRGLSPEDLRKFRQWFREFDSGRWSQQIEQDIAGGKLDSLAEEALNDLREGRSRPL